MTRTRTHLRQALHEIGNLERSLLTFPKDLRPAAQLQIRLQRAILLHVAKTRDTYTPGTKVDETPLMAELQTAMATAIYCACGHFRHTERPLLTIAYDLLQPIPALLVGIEADNQPKGPIQ